jgi:hypothetical protein
MRQEDYLDFYVEFEERVGIRLSMQEGGKGFRTTWAWGGRLLNMTSYRFSVQQLRPCGTGLGCDASSKQSRDLCDSVLASF